MIKYQTPQIKPSRLARDGNGEQSQGDRLWMDKTAETSHLDNWCNSHCRTFECHYENCPKVGKVHIRETYEMWERTK